MCFRDLTRRIFAARDGNQVCTFFDVPPTTRNAKSIVAHVAFARAAMDLDPAVMDVRCPARCARVWHG